MQRRKKQAMRLTVPALAIVGWLAMTSQGMALSIGSNSTLTNARDFRGCAARLLSAGIAAETVSQACAEALSPRDLGNCVYKIQRETQIEAATALPTCRQARRPEDLANCVVGIGRYSRDAVDPTVLSYCGRSLLPVRFAQCVVGLRTEIDFSAIQAYDSCIDASDRTTGYLPSFIPSTSQPAEFRPNYESTPLPPEATPTPSQLPTVPPATAPGSLTPGNQ
jgi:hypothetical protein